MTKTMALLITEETHPIAVAILAPGFSVIKKKLVIGNYLVINDVAPPPGFFDAADQDDIVASDDRIVSPANYRRLARRRGYVEPVLQLSNFWVPRKLFKKDFKPVAPKATIIETNFFEINRR